jgi:hypothetical protein
VSPIFDETLSISIGMRETERTRWSQFANRVSPRRSCCAIPRHHQSIASSKIGQIQHTGNSNLSPHAGFCQNSFIARKADANVSFESFLIEIGEAFPLIKWGDWVDCWMQNGKTPQFSMDAQ